MLILCMQDFLFSHFNYLLRMENKSSNFLRHHTCFKDSAFIPIKVIYIKSSNKEIHNH